MYLRFAQKFGGLTVGTTWLAHTTVVVLVFLKLVRVVFVKLGLVLWGRRTAESYFLFLFVRP